MNNPLTRAIGHRGWPLCRSYFLVLVESVSMALQDDNGLCSDRRLHWALGVLPDGDYEVLGGWTASQPDEPVWDQVFDELTDLGVDRIRFVVASGLATAEPALCVAYPSAILLPLAKARGTLTSGATTQAPVPSFAISAGHLRKVMAAQEAAQNLQRLVCRAIGRHGAFSGPADATEFVVDALHRAEQKTREFFASNSVASQALAGAAKRRSKSARIGGLRL